MFAQTKNKIGFAFCTTVMVCPAFCFVRCVSFMFVFYACPKCCLSRFLVALFIRVVLLLSPPLRFLFCFPSTITTTTAICSATAAPRTSSRVQSPAMIAVPALSISAPATPPRPAAETAPSTSSRGQATPAPPRPQTPSTQLHRRFQLSRPWPLFRKCRRPRPPFRKCRRPRPRLRRNLRRPPTRSRL